MVAGGETGDAGAGLVIALSLFLRNGENNLFFSESFSSVAGLSLFFNSFPVVTGIAGIGSGSPFSMRNFSEPSKSFSLSHGYHFKRFKENSWNFFSYFVERYSFCYCFSEEAAYRNHECVFSFGAQ